MESKIEFYTKGTDHKIQMNAMLTENVLETKKERNFHPKRRKIEANLVKGTTPEGAKLIPHTITIDTRKKIY